MPRQKRTPHGKEKKLVAKKKTSTWRQKSNSSPSHMTASYAGYLARDKMIPPGTKFFPPAPSVFWSFPVALTVENIYMKLSIRVCQLIPVLQNELTPPKAVKITRMTFFPGRKLSCKRALSNSESRGSWLFQNFRTGRLCFWGILNHWKRTICFKYNQNYTQQEMPLKKPYKSFREASHLIKCL